MSQWNEESHSLLLQTRLSAFAPSYEGTGRSLSLKLIQQLRQQSAQSQISTTAENKTTTTARLASGTSRVLTRSFPTSGCRWDQTVHLSHGKLRP